MIEMELKAVLRDKAEVKKRLEAQGCIWQGISIQKDAIYQSGKRERASHDPVFRIRICGEKKILTMKDLEADLDTAEEYEVEISDDLTVDKMLKRLGFFPQEYMVKKREGTYYKGYHIFLDEVEGLGNYIEIEKLSEHDAKKDKIYADMKKILLELGIGELDLEKKKYFELIRDKGD